MKADHINRIWESYWRAGYGDRPASGAQHDAMRQAFFAGATGLLSMMLRVLEPGTEPTEADMRLMTDIDAELSAFGRDLSGL